MAVIILKETGHVPKGKYGPVFESMVSRLYGH